MSQIVLTQPFKTSASYGLNFPKSAWALTALGVAALTLGFVYFVKKFIPDHQGKISWGSNEPKSTYLQKFTFYFRQRLFGLTNEEVIKKLKNKPFKTENLDIFNLGEDSHQYIAYVPGLRDNFLEILKETPATLIINLSDDVKSCDYNLYLKDTTPLFKCGFADQYLLNNKIIWHFILDDSDEKISDKEFRSSLIHLAASISKMVAQNKPIFVHCEIGLPRTAVFLSIVEFIHRREQFKGLSDAELRQKMISILEEIKEKSSYFHVISSLIFMVLNAEFLRQLVNLP